MQILLEKPEFENFIREQVNSGQYTSPSEVVEAALSRLMRPSDESSSQYAAEDFAPGELTRLVAEGEASLRKYGPLNAEEVFRELRQMRDPARLKAKKWGLQNLSDQAKRDLDEIWLHIAEDNFEVAGRVQDEIVAEVQKLAEHPGQA